MALTVIKAKDMVFYMWWVYIHEEPTYCERQAYKQGHSQDFPLGGAELYIYIYASHNS